MVKVKKELSNMTNNIKEEPKLEPKLEHNVKDEKNVQLEEDDENIPTTRSLRKRKYVAPVYDNSDEDTENESKSYVKKSKRGSKKTFNEEEDSDFELKEEEEAVSGVDNDVDFVEHEVDFEEEERPKSSSGRRSKTNTKAIKTQHLKSSRPLQKVKENENGIKTLKFSGEIPVDEKFIEIFGEGFIVYREGDLIYDCMLNQTNLQQNNNKFYLIQIVQNPSDKKFIVWMRWGRVGKDGQQASFKCGTDLNEAKEIFANKFHDKTKNEFEDKADFEKCHGKYDLVEKDYTMSADLPIEGENEKKNQNEIVKKEVPSSNLEISVQNLIEMICNISEMENYLKEMKFDAKKAPLGKLSQKQIKLGYAALKEIEELINQKSLTSNTFMHANNKFYTRIPHDFGMKVPPMIRTLPAMRDKMKLLEALAEIQVAVNAMKKESDILNPIDRHYEQLDCKIEPMDKDEQMVDIIEEYLQKNHAPTHNNYKLKLLEVYAVTKTNEKENFKSEYDNRMLLWHGSRMTNWAGILSQGLKIAPPEAPVTGYMFGKGVYFSDCSSKTANYCYTTMNKNIGLLSLSEVALGECNILKQADYEADELPKGKLSTKGIGKSEPESKDWVTLDDGLIIPIGKLKDTVDPKNASEYSLLYNEYIVYDVNQIKLRYLVKVEFVYDD